MSNKNDVDHLFNEYFNDVYHFLLYFTNDQNDAEDLTQETFIKVYMSYENFQGQSSIKTWIISIAKKTAVDSYRKKKWNPLLMNKLDSAQKSRDGIPEKSIESKGDREILQYALTKLKPNYRNVVILRGLKELSIKETSEILGWNETKVKVSYHRALKQLRKYVGYTNEGIELLHEEWKR